MQKQTLNRKRRVHQKHQTQTQTETLQIKQTVPQHQLHPTTAAMDRICLFPFHRLFRSQWTTSDFFTWANSSRNSHRMETKMFQASQPQPTLGTFQSVQTMSYEVPCRKSSRALHILSPPFHPSQRWAHSNVSKPFCSFTSWWHSGARGGWCR